jgi:hypothetical protein
MVLADLYELEQFPVHDREEIDLADLPPRAVVQVHWHRTVDLVRDMEAAELCPVVIARHPLDVLVSIWHFAAHEPAVARWLKGEGGDEEGLLGVDPSSSDFLSYALGPRAAALLSVTSEWWSAPGTVKVRYEELVTDPGRALKDVMSRCGPTSRELGGVLERHTIDRLRPTAQNNHFWKGQPGNWRAHVPMESARRIRAAHTAVFDALGYDLQPYGG